MIEIVPNEGVGPLKLSMSITEVEEILGPPDSTYRRDDRDYLSPRQKRMFSGQIVEIRNKSKFIDLIDLIYEKNYLVGINMPGRSENISIFQSDLKSDRMVLLKKIYEFDSDVFISPEDYFFRNIGFSLSRSKNRKDINYATLYNSAFKERFLDYEAYTKFSGPIIP